MKFKKFTAFLLALILCAAYSGSFAVYAQTINELKQQQQSIEKDSGDIQKALDETRQEKNYLAEEIADLDTQVGQAQKELSDVKNRLELSTKNLEKTELELKEATADKKVQSDLFSMRVKYFHENGTYGYLSLALQSKSFTDLLSRIEYINEIIAHDEKMLTRLRENENIIRVKTDEIAKEKSILTSLVEEQRGKTQSLEKLLAQKQELSVKYETDEAEYEKQLAENERASKEVSNMINSAIREQERKAAEERARAAAATSSKNAIASAPLSYSGGQLEWPVPGHTRISSGYGERINHI